MHRIRVHRGLFYSRVRKNYQRCVVCDIFRDVVFGVNQFLILQNEKLALLKVRVYARREYLVFHRRQPIVKVLDV